jgi:tripartite-type tricarboxylate transporter receptor subunit TctC
MRPSLRTLLVVAAGSLALLAPLHAPAQGYPNRPIKLVVPFPPGGTTDAMARVVARQVETQIGQPVVVENRPGANGILGSEQVANAPPDGYTLMHTSPSIVINEFIYKQMRFAVDKDFTPITNLVLGTGYLVLVSADSPIKTLDDLARAAKVKKEALSYGSAGLGNTTHLSAALLTAELGVEMLHVPFKGLAEAMNAVIAGNVQLALTPPTVAVNFVRGGRLRALAFTGAQRWAELPNVPTVAEQGHPGFEVNGGWFGWFGPKGMPQAAADRIQSEVARALQAPAVKEFIEKGGYAADGRKPPEFAKFVGGELARYREAVKAAKIEPQ